MLAGLTSSKAVYVAPLFMEPNYTDTPTSSMELWFIDLLQGPEASFHTLAEASCALPKWGAYAEVIHYRCLNDKRCECEGELEEILACICTIQDCQEAARHCMEAG